MPPSPRVGNSLLAATISPHGFRNALFPQSSQPFQDNSWLGLAPASGLPPLSFFTKPIHPITLVIVNHDRTCANPVSAAMNVREITKRIPQQNNFPGHLLSSMATPGVYLTGFPYSPGIHLSDVTDCPDFPPSVTCTQPRKCALDHLPREGKVSDSRRTFGGFPTW